MKKQTVHHYKISSKRHARGHTQRVADLKFLGVLGIAFVVICVVVK